MEIVAMLSLIVVYETKKGESNLTEIEGEINSRLFNAAERIVHLDELLLEGIEAIECLPSVSILPIRNSGRESRKSPTHSIS